MFPKTCFDPTRGFLKVKLYSNFPKSVCFSLETSQSWRVMSRYFFCQMQFFIRSHFNSSDVRASDLGFTRIPFGDEEALRAAVALVGPVSVVLDAEHFADYKSGGCSVKVLFPLKKGLFFLFSSLRGFPRRFLLPCCGGNSVS